MDKTKLDMSRFKVTKGGSEWQEVIRMFEDKLNPPRVAGGFRKLSPAVIAKKLKIAGVDNCQQGYDLYRKCQEFETFGKGFWYFVRGSHK